MSVSFGGCLCTAAPSKRAVFALALHEIWCATGLPVIPPGTCPARTFSQIAIAALSNRRLSHRPAVSSLEACTTPTLQSTRHAIGAPLRAGILQPLTIPVIAANHVWAVRVTQLQGGFSAICSQDGNFSFAVIVSTPPWNASTTDFKREPLQFEPLQLDTS